MSAGTPGPAGHGSAGQGQPAAIMIGPPGAGKTTVGALVAERLVYVVRGRGAYVAAHH